MTSSLMPPEVIDAIEYASKHYVMLDELHDKVGERIAALVRSEAAMVTSGAASALTLGTAAVLTGTDRQKIIDLPDLTNMKNEVIIQKSHRFGYDHAGGKVARVGASIDPSLASPGVSKASPTLP
jgi:L-seryl-tRNA(Ser) seleniumtransferase